LKAPPFAEDRAIQITRRWLPALRPITLGALVGCSALFHRGATVRFHGEANDPVGDTARVADARVRRAADLVYAGVRVTDDDVRFTVRFARGSFDSTNTGVIFDLDTDRDSTTGVGGLGVGAEYGVSLNAGSHDATVDRAATDANCPGTRPCRYEPIQRAALIISADGMDAVVPRRAFAHFDGRLDFRVVAYAMLDHGRHTITSDHLPNLPAQFVVVR